jgi:membrane associated rhomboid family serine protease
MILLAFWSTAVIARSRPEGYSLWSGMDINHILLIVAVLNLSGDLYNIMRFKSQIPRWIRWANLLALVVCGTAWLLLPEESGFIAMGVVITYMIAIKAGTRKQARGEPLPSPATKLLIALNCGAFGAQYFCGATNDPEVFIKLGAAFSPLLSEGEWWRIFTAQFLHWGFMHLLFNMMGLWILGPFVETMVGFWRYIGLYLLCGASGMLIAWIASILMPDPYPVIMVGASASVLGLVGAQAAIALLAYQRSGNLAAKAQLSSMMQIVVLQALFDMMVPQVSSTAHIGGAATGFLVSYGSFSYLLRKRAREAS